MKSHYSAAELAAMKLPGLPTSVRGVIDRARKDGWAFRQVPGKGGKGGIRREYLPPARIAKLIAAHGTIQANGTAAEVALGLTVSLTEAVYILRWLEKRCRRG